MRFDGTAPPHPADSFGWFCRLALLLARQSGDILPQIGRPPSALEKRLRLLWFTARPALFLAGLCLFFGALFLPLSFTPSVVFFLAGLGAVGIALQLLQPAPAPKPD